MGHPARAAARDGASKSRQGTSGTSKSRQGASATKGLLGKTPRARPTRRRPRRRSPPAWLTAPASRIRGAWLALLKAGPVAVPRARRHDGTRTLTGAASKELPLADLSRTDLVWAAATGAAAAALFATALTSHPALSDASEAVTGVSSVGILHAPGYISYVLAAKAFTLLVPFGNEAFRVNLFSLVCGALSIAGVQLLARRCGAARWAASVGALTLAAGAGFWFYATFAKHDMFSGLMFLVALHLTLAWQQRPRTGTLIALAAVLAIGLGASWPLIVLLLPTVAFVLLRSRSRLSLPSLAAATATGLVIVVALGGFVMVRAGQNPAINFDDATSISRLVELVSRADFIPHGAPLTRSTAKPSGGQSPPANTTGRLSGASRQASSGKLAAIMPIASVSKVGGLRNFVTIFARELGIVGLVLAAFGLIVSLLRRRTTASWPLVIAFTGNLLGADLLVAPGGAIGTNLQLIEEGFILGCYFVLATWLAVGATALVDGVSGVRLRSGASLAAHRKVVVPLAAVVAAGVLLVPSILGHSSVAHRAGKPYADRLATAVFAELPPRAAVFVSNSELADPLVYQQVLGHRRPDVLVVDMYALSYAWYRQLLERKLGAQLPPDLHDSVLNAREVAKWLAGSRPVYMDLHGAQVMAGNDTFDPPVPGNLIGYQPVGILARLVGGTGPQLVRSPAALDSAFRQAERTAGMPDQNWNLWPNGLAMQIFYNTAALEVARAYYEHRDLAGMQSALENELTITPDDTVAQQDLQKLTASQLGQG